MVKSFSSSKFFDHDAINEVYPRIWMSGYGPSEDEKVINRLKITHILSVVPGARPLFAGKGVKYLIFSDI